MFYTYVLRSIKDNKFYIGTTGDLQKRIHQHNTGHSKSTKFRCPFNLVYTEQHQTRSEAMKREWYFKNTTEGNIWLKKHISYQE